MQRACLSEILVRDLESIQDPVQDPVLVPVPVHQDQQHQGHQVQDQQNQPQDQQRLFPVVEDAGVSLLTPAMAPTVTLLTPVNLDRAVRTQCARACCLTTS